MADKWAWWGLDLGTLRLNLTLKKKHMLLAPDLFKHYLYSLLMMFTSTLVVLYPFDTLT